MHTFFPNGLYYAFSRFVHGESVSYDMFPLPSLHSLRGSSVIDGDAEPPRTTKSILLEIVRHVKDVFEQPETSPDWLLLLRKMFKFS